MTTTVTVCVQVATLLQQSVACQVLVTTSGQNPLVCVLRIVRVTFVPQQASKAAGGSNVHVLPHCTVLLLAQVKIGGVVSTTVTVWLQVLVLPHESVASHVCVMTCGQVPFVTVLNTVIVTLVPLQVSKAAGGSKVHALPHCTVLLVAQVKTGGVLSTTFTVWLQMLVLPHKSVASQVCVMN